MNSYFISYIFYDFLQKYVLTISVNYNTLYKHVHRNARVCSYEKQTTFTLELEVPKLANIKSAKKRILVNRTKADRNKAIKSAVKTSIKKVDAAVATNDKAAAEAALKDAVSTISKATSKGVFHKNNCARKVSHLTKAVNSMN